MASMVDYPLPSPDAVHTASGVLAWLWAHGLSVESISPDVLGGVAIYVDGNGGRAWIAIMNNGGRTIVLTRSRKSTGYPLSDDTLSQMKTFLETEK